MYMEQVTIEKAIKATDWVCTGGINAGDESYRVYKSEIANQKVVNDGKDEKFDLAYLKAVDNKKLD